METESSKKAKTNVLEEKSKEELVELVKKYLNLLQKAKNKSDGLAERCAVLETEKNVAIEEQQSMEKEFLSKIAELRNVVSAYNAEKEKFAEKEREVIELKQQLKELAAEKASMRESEEQLQCLQMQLQSMKASCLCIQEENGKLLSLNEELSKENAALKDDYNTVVKKLEKKLHEYSELLNEKSELEIQHKSQVQNFQSEIESLKADFNSKSKTESPTLVEEIEDLRKQNDLYKKYLNENVDFALLMSDIEALQNDKRDLEDEIKHLKEQRDCKTNKPVFEKDSSSPQNSELAQKLEDELLQSRAQNIELLKQIEFLSSLSDAKDLKAGIENALLHGASAQRILIPAVEERNKFSISQPQSDSNAATVCGPEATLETAPSIGVEDSGLEYTLLHGNDMTGYLIPSQEPLHVFRSFPSQDSTYDNKIELMENEIKSLEMRVEGWANLCNDTLEENKILKQKLEECQSKVFVHQETNTDFDWSGNEKTIAGENNHTDLQRPRESSDVSDVYSELHRKLIELLQEVSSEDFCLGTVFEDNPLSLLQALEGSYNRKIDAMEKNINHFNLQLEILISGTKQGVRQKNSAISNQARNRLEDNLSLLKVLLDDLVTSSNNYASKLRSLESSLSSERKGFEDELAQLKELNQFLEVENRELDVEIKRLKQYVNDIENSNDQGYSEERYQRSPDLYSIEESNETEEKPDDNSNYLDVNNAIIPVSEISVIKEDHSTQVELDFNERASNLLHELEEKNLNLSDNAKVIEKLTKENADLAEKIQEKSDLVENIHCQMDSLLEKVEELTQELQNKEIELKQSKASLKALEEKLVSSEKQFVSALITTRNSVIDLKLKNNGLSDDLKSFALSTKEFIRDSSDKILKKVSDKLDGESKIKLWLNQFNDELASYLNIFRHHGSSEVSVSSDFLPFGRDLPSADSSSFDFLKNSCDSLVKNLEMYRLQVVPDLENKLAELEGKFAENLSESFKGDSLNSDASEKEESVEVLKNQLSETEVKMGKFKQIALKLKKELSQIKEELSVVNSEKEKLYKQNDSLVKELNKLSEEQCKSLQNYQSLQNEYDKLQDEYEEYQANKKKLEADFSSQLLVSLVELLSLSLQNEYDKLQDEYEEYQANKKKLEVDFSSQLLELSSSKEQLVELQSQLKSAMLASDLNLNQKKDLESKCADLESKVIVLESKVNEKSRKINSLEIEVSKHLKEISSLLAENKSLTDQLDLAKKEGKKKSLLDLEMADFEKSISGLKNQVQLKEAEIDELQSELKSMKERYDCLLEEMRSTETLKETEFKRAENLKDALEKTKSDLMETKKHEAELISKLASLEVQLERLIQEKEENKLHLSESSAQVQHLQDALKTSSENHHRIVKSYEQKVSNQKQEILLAHKEIEAVKQEFENYKIRVHSVLKQQKMVTPNIATMDEELKEKLETMNEKLKLQIKDLSEKLTALNLEHDALQEEHEVLMQRYSKVINEQEEKEKGWQKKLEEVTAEKARLSATQEEIASQHLLQNEMLVATYKKQIKIMSEEHKRIVNDLQKQLDAADIEIARLQRDQQKQQGLPLTPLPHDNSPFDIMSQERQEGEGSESTDEISTPVRHLSLATIPTSGFLPFEKLIQSSIEPGTPASYASTHDSEKFQAELNAANKKIEHLSELLNDSESTNMRLSEQVRVLKDEVRRIENNQEREKHGDNLEYLKNVFIKFASLQPGSERAMLVPVLTTMLKLNQEEQHMLKSVAGDLGSEETTSAGWSNYLHRWSGLS